MPFVTISFSNEKDAGTGRLGLRKMQSFGAWGDLMDRKHLLRLGVSIS